MSQGPAYRSHSQLTTYMECPTKYKLKYLEKVKEQPAIWLPGGTGFHSATEAFDKGEIGRADIAATFVEEFEKEVRTMEEQSGIARDEFRAAGRATKANPHKENYSWWRDAGQAMAIEYVDWRENNPHLEIAEFDGRPMVESEFLPILEGVPVKMYLDRILVDTTTGSPLIMDLKTGSRTPPDLQLGVYRVGVQKLLGVTVDYGAFYKARTGDLSIPVEITRWDEATITQLFVELDYAIKQEMFLPSITRDCASCGVRQHCPFMGGE